MIVDERITAYINSLSLEEIPFLEELEQTALKTGCRLSGRRPRAF